MNALGPRVSPFCLGVKEEKKKERKKKRKEPGQSMMMISPGCFRRCNLGASTAAETLRRWRGAKVREREKRESGVVMYSEGGSLQRLVCIVAREKSRTKWGSV
jgi:hypothetical protein